MQTKKKLSVVTGAVLAFFSTGVVHADLTMTKDVAGSVLLANHDGKDGGCSGKDGGCSGKEAKEAKEVTEEKTEHKDHKDGKKGHHHKAHAKKAVKHHEEKVKHDAPATDAPTTAPAAE